MVKKVICSIALLLFLASCGVRQQPSSVKYPKKSTTSSSRQSGPAMSFYEQAEEDLDVSNGIVVTPPDQVKKEREVD